MKQTRFTEAQIVSILQEADADGACARDVCNRTESASRLSIGGADAIAPCR